MNIILKYLRNNLKEKMGRTLLVVFSIAVSSGLIFANESFSSTMKKMLEEASLRWSGNSDLIIDIKKSQGAKNWIDNSLIIEDERYEYILPCIMKTGLYYHDVESMQSLKIIGTNLEQFDRHNPIELVEGTKNDLAGLEIIIGEDFAAENDIYVSDSINLEFDNKLYKFKVKGISGPNGLFRRNKADGGFGIIPIEFFEEIYNASSNLIFIDVKADEDIQPIYSELDELFSEYDLSYSRAPEILKAETNSFVMPFKISSIAVILMSLFIIYTAFQLLVLERIRSIGIFRSMGCSRNTMIRILLSESTILGLIGGVLGCFIGLSILLLIKRLYFAGEIGIAEPPISFRTIEVAITLISAIIITLGCAIAPILKTTKFSIKDIILESYNKRIKNRKYILVLGLILLSNAILLPYFLPNNFSGMVISTINVTGALLGIIILIPKIVQFVTKLVIMSGNLCYEIELGLRNILDSIYLKNNLSLFVSVIAIIGFMSSLFLTLSNDLERTYLINQKYDVVMSMHSIDQDMIEELNALESISNYSVEYMLYSLKLPEYGTFLNSIYGIDGENYFRLNYLDIEDTLDAINRLSEGRNIILTDVLKSKLNLDIGDYITIPIEGNDILFKITGFVDTTRGIGHVGFISSSVLKSISTNYLNYIYVEGKGEQIELRNQLKQKFIRQFFYIETKEDIYSANSDKVNGIFNSINSYANIAMIVGIIGIINNIVASYLMRKRDIARLRSIGMSRQSVKKMLITETVAIGFLGVILGLGTIMIMSLSIPNLVSIFWGNVPVAYPVKKYLYISIFSIITMIVISIIPTIKSEKLSIIDSIKYE